MFTALVEALLILERQKAAEWRYWAAWKIVTGAANAVMGLAGWRPEHWRNIFRSPGIDHWKKTPRCRRPEVETFKLWTQIELTEADRN